MFSTVMEALIDFWNTLTPAQKASHPTPDSIGIEYLPEKYDDTPLYTVVNFRTVRTVREYKEAGRRAMSDSYDV